MSNSDIRFWEREIGRSPGHSGSRNNVDNFREWLKSRNYLEVEDKEDESWWGWNPNSFHLTGETLRVKPKFAFILQIRGPHEKASWIAEVRDETGMTSSALANAVVDFWIEEGYLEVLDEGLCLNKSTIVDAGLDVDDYLRAYGGVVSKNESQRLFSDIEGWPEAAKGRVVSEDVVVDFQHSGLDIGLLVGMVIRAANSAGQAIVTWPDVAANIRCLSRVAKDQPTANAVARTIAESLISNEDVPPGLQAFDGGIQIVDPDVIGKSWRDLLEIYKGDYQRDQGECLERLGQTREHAKSAATKIASLNAQHRFYRDRGSRLTIRGTVLANVEASWMGEWEAWDHDSDDIANTGANRLEQAILKTTSRLNLHRQAVEQAIDKDQAEWAASSFPDILEFVEKARDELSRLIEDDSSSEEMTAWIRRLRVLSRDQKRLRRQEKLIVSRLNRVKIHITNLETAIGPDGDRWLGATRKWEAEVTEINFDPPTFDDFDASTDEDESVEDVFETGASRYVIEATDIINGTEEQELDG